MCVAVFFLALAVRVLAAAFVRSPGYMDAYYYFHVGARLAAGGGLTETVAWNYLSPPSRLPRPAGAYWPPGAPLLAAAGLSALSGISPRGALAWRAAQVAPALLSSAVPAGAYVAARRLTPGPGERRRAATVAGLIILSGVYFPYWVTTDTFTPFALIGGAALWLSAEAARNAGHCRVAWQAALAAFLAGLGQLARPDAALLVVAPLVALLCRQCDPAARKSAQLATVITAFAVGLGQWLGRNWLTWHTLTPPGASAALWLRDYDDLFAFAAPPTFERWRAAGLAGAAAARAGALAGNLGVLGQPMLYYLAPFALYGMWRLRRRPEHWPALAYLATLYLVLSLLFPFQSVRGGFFHSLSAMLPFLAIWTVAGLEGAVAAAARRRRWIEPQAQRVFAGALLGFSALSSVYFLALQAGRWQARLDAYRQVAQLLDARAPTVERVMAVDPPGFWYASGRDAVVIPSDGFDALLAAAKVFDARYLVVEASGPAYLAPLWLGTEPVAGFRCLGTTGAAAVYLVDPSHGEPPASCPPVGGRRTPPG